MSSQIGWPEGASAACGSVSPSASATTCDVAAVPRNWQPPPGLRAGAAAQLGGLFQGQLAVRKAGADRLDLAGVFALARRQRDAAGHEHARQIASTRPAPSSSPAGPCRRWPRRAPPARGQRADQPAEHDRRVVAIRQAVDHAGRALRPAVARIGDNRRRTARRRAAAAPRPPPGRAGRPPSGPCDSPAQSACRRRRAGRPAC